MHRYFHLYEKLDRDLLSKAFDNAAKGKMNQQSVREAVSNKEMLIEDLYHRIQTKTYIPSSYTIIHKHEPKYREIFVAPFYPDRVVHHAVMLILINILLPKFFEHSYSCIKGKGQHKAALYNHKLVKTYKYCLKCDISKFYPSINRNILMSLFEKIIGDKDFLQLISNIIFMAPDSEWANEIYKKYFKVGLRLYNKLGLNGEIINFQNNINVPIGNYCSQWFGNFYLTELDNLIASRFCSSIFSEIQFKDKLKHVRYCDDIIIYSNNKENLELAKKCIEQYLFFFRQLTLSKAKIFPTRLGVDFCGYKVYPNGKIIVRPSTKKRIKKRIRTLIYKIHHGYTTINSASSVVGSYKGLILFSNSTNLYKAIKLDKLENVLNYYRINYNELVTTKVRMEF